MDTNATLINEAGELFLPLLNKELFGNKVWSLILSLGLFVLILLLTAIIQFVVLRRMKRLAEKTKTFSDDHLINKIRKNVLPPLYYGAFWIAIVRLNISEKAIKLINIFGVIILSFFIMKLITGVIRYTLEKLWLKKEDGQEKIRSFKGLFPAINIFVWIIGLIFLMDNLGFDISGLIAGLGIGGLAVAIAAQAVLGDLFSYFSILLDKPFELGDFVINGDYMGTIEKIGIKTTRIRSLGGEQIIFSNSDLTNSRVRNYKRMEQRRVVFKLGVVYGTNITKLKKIPEIIKNIINSVELTRFDRAHFAEYGDFNLNYEVVYYVLSSDYNKYMDIQQDINFKINESFIKEQIEFAYPTQTIYMEKE